MENKIPKEWRLAKVISLYKKGDKTDANNYREMRTQHTKYMPVSYTHLDVYKRQELRGRPVGRLPRYFLRGRLPPMLW